MFRNLFYAIFFHLILFFVIYLGYFNIVSKPRQLQKEYRALMKEDKFDINIIDEELLRLVKNNIGKKRKTRQYKKFGIEKKIALYKKVKAEEEQGNETEMLTDDTLPENIFYYIETPVYVAENKLSETEIARIKKSNSIKEAIRREIKLRKKDLELSDHRRNAEYTKEQEIKIAQKPVVLLNERTNERALINSVWEVNFETIDRVLFRSKNEEPVFSDEEIENAKSNQIFSKQDLEKLNQGYSLRNEMEKYNLTAREKGNIQRQIKTCYRRAITRSDIESSVIINATIKVARDGYIDMNAIKIEDNEFYTKEDYDRAVNNVKTALVLCNPLINLPSEKYIMWKEMSFVFDAQNIN